MRARPAFEAGGVESQIHALSPADFSCSCSKSLWGGAKTDMPSQKLSKVPGGLPLPGGQMHLSHIRALRTWPCNDGDKELGFCDLSFPPGASWHP